MKEENIYENLSKVPHFYQNYLLIFLKKLKGIFRKKLLSIILFGSVARGKWSKNSDIDLLLIFSNEITDISKLDKLLTNITIEFYKKNEL